MIENGHWPGWPRLLSREQLCLYLGGICEVTLTKICPVAPLDLGVRVVRWNRHQIDAWLDTLPSRLPMGRSANDNGEADRLALELMQHGDANSAIKRARARAGAAGR